jgi:DNA-binding SARP family transcriptional activator
MAHLSVALLGAAQVRHGDTPVFFPTRKSLAMLVYVLLEQRAHSRDKLVDLFWPASGEAGRTTLRSTLARLRNALAVAPGEHHLLAQGDAVRFDFSSSFDLDLHLVESAARLAGGETPGGWDTANADPHLAVLGQLQEAAGLWRGEFLDGFFLSDAPGFEDWLALQRETWRWRIQLILDRLSEVYSDLGKSPQAIETATRWLSLDPVDERALRRLMQLHFAAGDRESALRAYEACRTQLIQDLHVQPSPETEALIERIRKGIRSITPLNRRDEVPPADLLEGPFVGREEQFAKLVELYHATLQGRNHVAVLQGEAGFGKTRIAREFLSWAAGKGADVCEGRAFEFGARIPYQPLVEAIRQRLERENAPEDLLADVWLTELSRLVPELRERYPDLSEPSAEDGTEHMRLFEAIARLWQALAEQGPVVLLLDDVQWADSATLDVLLYVARRMSQGRTGALLLICLRTEAMTNEIDEWLAGLRRDLTVTSLELAPLGLADIVQLVQGMGAHEESNTAAEELANWLYAETGGSPFFLLETIRALVERRVLSLGRRFDGEWRIEVRKGLFVHDLVPSLLPAGVQRVIHARLARLDPEASDLLVAASILGQVSSFESLCAVGGLSEADGLLALDKLVRAHLMREVGAGCYLFGHDKIRDVVTAEAGDARRRVFHRRALETLQSVAAPASELVQHALASGLEDLALRLSVEAGDDAMRLLAPRDAATQYERAMSIALTLGRGELLPELHGRRGKAFVKATKWGDARQELELALTGLRPGQQESRAEFLVDLAEAYWWALDVPKVRSCAREALSIAQRLGRGDLETRAMAWSASAEGSAGYIGSSLRANELAIARAQELQITPPARALMNKSLALYWLGHFEKAVISGRDAVAAADNAGDVAWTMTALPQLGLALAGTGRYSSAASAFEEARRLGREWGVDNLLARSICMSAGFHLDLFDFPDAEALSQEAKDLALSLDFRPPATSASIDLLLNYVRRHDIGRAEDLLEEVALAAAGAAGFHGWLWQLRLSQARAEIALGREEWEEALRQAGETIEQSRTKGRVKYLVLGLCIRAEALAARNAQSEAVLALRNAMRLARSTRDPALLLRPASMLLAFDGDDALAGEALTAVDRIRGELPDLALLRRFEAADPVRLILSYRS